ncbi:MAG: hypothetical protein IJ561_00760 [Ruminococcus sp.]|nr:hypothetical protein [Ruminococcus sp.]
MLHGYLDLPTFTFWRENNIWTGSVFQNFNYRIVQKKLEDDTKVLYSVIWLGSLCFDLVKPEDYVCEHHEEFSPEGLERTIEFLNSKVEEYKQNGGKL